MIDDLKKRGTDFLGDEEKRLRFEIQRIKDDWFSKRAKTKRLPSGENEMRSFTWSSTFRDVPPRTGTR